MVIVDTTVWIDYLRGTTTKQTTWLDQELSRRRIGLTDVILCEVLQGVRSDSIARKVQRELCKFEVFTSGGLQLAVAAAAAANYRILRKRGYTVHKMFDRNVLP